MKFIAVAALSLLSLASAVPHGGCTPATYQCSYKDGVPGWEVCDVSGKWIYAGDCPPDTVCKFFDASASPYCVPEDFQFP